MKDDDEWELFIGAMFRGSDPETSEIAAEKVSVRLRKLQHEVYEYFLTVEHATLRDVEKHFRHPGSTYRSRVPELVKQGLLRRAMRKGEGVKVLQDGGWRAVWELT